MNKNTQSSASLAISATGLRKSFGEKVVLDGIDIQVAEGLPMAATVISACTHRLLLRWSHDDNAALG
jgi:ABC-type transporter Mla maintaining outer membrane lipid asymmetry ATPase subunit MlaF